MHPSSEEVLHRSGANAISRLFITTHVTTPHLRVIVLSGEQPDVSDYSDKDARVDIQINWTMLR